MAPWSILLLKGLGSWRRRRRRQEFLQIYIWSRLMSSCACAISNRTALDNRNNKQRNKETSNRVFRAKPKKAGGGGDLVQFQIDWDLIFFFKRWQRDKRTARESSISDRTERSEHFSNRTASLSHHTTTTTTISQSPCFMISLVVFPLFVYYLIQSWYQSAVRNVMTRPFASFFPQCTVHIAYLSVWERERENAVWLVSQKRYTRDKQKQVVERNQLKGKGSLTK